MPDIHINANISSSRKYCSVPGCGARSGTMFSFPKDSLMRLRWKVACKVPRMDVSASSRVVCIRHFPECDVRLTRKFHRKWCLRRYILAPLTF